MLVKENSIPLQEKLLLQQLDMEKDLLQDTKHSQIITLDTKF